MLLAFIMIFCTLPIEVFAVEIDPDKAMDNYRQGLIKINSQEKYDRYSTIMVPPCWARTWKSIRWVE